MSLEEYWAFRHCQSRARERYQQYITPNDILLIKRIIGSGRARFCKRSLEFEGSDVYRVYYWNMNVYVAYDPTTDIIRTFLPDDNSYAKQKYSTKPWQRVEEHEIV